MQPFPWRAPEVESKFTLHLHFSFYPLIEECRPTRGGVSFSGYYFLLGRWVSLRNSDSPEGRRGYIAHLEREEFREREFPIEELSALWKTLSAISIPLGNGSTPSMAPTS